jgi:uncharacterized membrane protein YfcA
MTNVSYVLALFGFLFLVVAGVAWRRIVRKPDQDRPSLKDEKRTSSAAMMMVIAFVLSAAGALVGIVGWIER